MSSVLTGTFPRNGNYLCRGQRLCCLKYMGSAMLSLDIPKPCPGLRVIRAPNGRLDNFRRCEKKENSLSTDNFSRVKVPSSPYYFRRSKTVTLSITSKRYQLRCLLNSFIRNSSRGSLVMLWTDRFSSNTSIQKLGIPLCIYTHLVHRQMIRRSL